jgi:hypothetical protein
MREKFLIYAQIVFWVIRAIFDGIFVSATSRREPFGDQRQDSCIWSKRPEIAHDSSTFCAPGKDKSGTCAQPSDLLKLQGFACRLRSDVLVDLAANRAMLY